MDTDVYIGNNRDVGVSKWQGFGYLRDIHASGLKKMFNIWLCYKDVLIKIS